MSVTATSVTEFLESIEFGEYAFAFEEAGFTDILDVMAMSDDDLQKIGMEKLGHRKKFLRIVEELGGGPRHHDEDAQDHGPPASPNSCGRKIVCDLVSANLSVDIPASDLRVYVKLSICRLVNGAGLPIASTVRHSATVCGSTTPQFRETHEFVTNFQDGHFFILEVKQKRTMSNKRLAISVIPMRHFHAFTQDTLLDSWFPLRLGRDTNKGQVHLRLRVPGGAPMQTGKAYRVTGVKMENRKLVVSVINGRVPPNDNGDIMSPYVKIVLPNNGEVSGTTRADKSTTDPIWNERFEFFTEIKNTKFLLVKLKESRLMGNRTIAVAKIPLMFFLSQREAEPIDQWFRVYDDQNVERGQVHLKFEVMQRAENEMNRINRGRSTSTTYRPTSISAGAPAARTLLPASGEVFDISHQRDHVAASMAEEAQDEHIGVDATRWSAPSTQPVAQPTEQQHEQQHEHDDREGEQNTHPQQQQQPEVVTTNNSDENIDVVNSDDDDDSDTDDDNDSDTD